MIASDVRVFLLFFFYVARKKIFTRTNFRGRKFSHDFFAVPSFLISSFHRKK